MESLSKDLYESAESEYLSDSMDSQESKVIESGFGDAEPSVESEDDEEVNNSQPMPQEELAASSPSSEVIGSARPVESPSNPDGPNKIPIAGNVKPSPKRAFLACVGIGLVVILGAIVISRSKKR